MLGSNLSLLFALCIISNTDTKSAKLYQVTVPPSLVEMTKCAAEQSA